MRIILVLVLCVGFLLPIALQGAKLYLKDGSVITGDLVASREDSVFFRTSFRGLVAFSARDVMKIELADSPPPASRGESPPFPGFTNAEPGSLFVLFQNEKLSSKIVVHRDMEKELCMQANTIEQALFVDNELAFSCSDSIPDKKIRSGPNTIYKNTMQFKDIRIGLPSGPHSCRIVIGNRGRTAHAKRFENEPLYETLELGSILVYPAKATTVTIDVKKKMWGMGAAKLRAIQ
ncbi:MAG: hypothetical protein HY770_00045 [Chitinivibrionia bacterium]|nr:hypothetical protein [Chitinivibrionia bacterium]